MSDKRKRVEDAFVEWTTRSRYMYASANASLKKCARTASIVIVMRGLVYFAWRFNRVTLKVSVENA